MDLWLHEQTMKGVIDHKIRTLYGQIVAYEKWHQLLDIIPKKSTPEISPACVLNDSVFVYFWKQIL